MYNTPYGCGPRGWRGQAFNRSAAVNITETDNEYLLQLYAPGLQKENISVTTKGDILSIRYEAKESASTGRYTRREFKPENIDRSFDLKGKVDVDRLNASYAEGILTVQLPKNHAARRPAQQVSVG